MNINNELKTKFRTNTSNEVDFGLLQQNIIKSVIRLEKRRLSIKFSFWVGFALFTTFGVIGSGISFYQQFITSGAKELISIALTDTNVIFANGMDFFYSLAESLPIGNVAIGLAAAAGLLYSLRRLSGIHFNNLSNHVTNKLYGV